MIKGFEKQAEEAVAESVMAAEDRDGVKVPDTIRELLIATYKAGGYQYEKMLEMERVEGVEYMTRRFGQATQERISKAMEELTELSEAYQQAVTCEDFEDFIDELADLNLVIFHLAGMFCLSQSELVAMALEKVKLREINPNYKRKPKC